MISFKPEEVKIVRVLVLYLYGAQKRYGDDFNLSDAVKIFVLSTGIPVRDSLVDYCFDILTSRNFI